MKEIIQKIRKFSDHAADILGVIGGVSAMAGNLKKATGAEGKKESTMEGEKGLPDIKFGGTLDLSDETAFSGLLAKLELDSDCTDKHYAHEVSKYLKTLPRAQRQKFRAVVGSLGNTEYIKSYNKVERQTSSGRKWFESVPVKGNLGVDFLKIFATLSNDEEREVVCEAIGVIVSHDETLKKIKKVRRRIAGKKYRGAWTELTSPRRS